MKNTLAFLTARGAQLPPGEESRLETVTLDTGESDRKVIDFADGVTNQCMWTLRVPDLYKGTGTLYADFLLYSDANDNGNDATLSVEIESIPDNSDTSSSSFDTANSANYSCDDTNLQFSVSVALTNKDSMAVGDLLRVRFKRLGADGGDSATGNLKLIMCELYEVVDTFNVIVETFTLDSTDISNKYITLANTPAVDTRVILIVKGAGGQYYGDDYTMSGNQLSWDSLGLDGILVSGDKLTVWYDI